MIPISEVLEEAAREIEGLYDPLDSETARCADALRAAIAEREACAKVCDDYEDWCDTWGQDDKHMAAVSAASELAQAIRSRGEK